MKKHNERKVHLVRGSTLNKIYDRIDEAEQRKKGSKSSPDAIRTNTTVQVFNDTGATWSAGRAVGYSDHTIDPDPTNQVSDAIYRSQYTFKAEPTSPTSKKFGVLQATAPNSFTGNVVIAGVATAIIKVANKDHEYAKPNDTDGELESTSSFSSIKILFIPTTLTDGSGPCKVLIGDCPKGSVKLENCETGLIVYSENVDVGGDQKLLDVVDKVVTLKPSALLDAACWMVIGEVEHRPEICPTVCAVVDDCAACGGGGQCFEFLRCGTTATVRYASITSIDVPIAVGSTVMLDDGFCYTVSLSSSCSSLETITVLDTVTDCNSCDDCWVLTACYSSAEIDIFKDDHNLSVGDVISIGGTCYTVGPEPPTCEFAVHVAIDSEGLFSDCDQCGCFLFVPLATIDPPLVPITAVVAALDGEVFVPTVGKIVRLDDGYCYRVERTDDCVDALSSVVVLIEHDTPEECVLYFLQDCENPTVEIVTYSLLSFYDDSMGSPPITVFKRAEDGRCYKVIGIAPETEGPFAVETMVETIYGLDCLDCTDPTYFLNPICPSCEEANPNSVNCETVLDAVPVAGISLALVTDSDLSEFVGQLIKFEGVCYEVSEFSNGAIVSPNISVDVATNLSGPFVDCESCQKECIWVVSDVTAGDGSIRQMRYQVIVDRICAKEEVTIIETGPCPTETTGP